MMKKVIVTMSGGVDSAVAALLLKRQGFDVTGVTLNLLPDNENSDDIRDAAETAASLGIPHFILDMRKEFSENVIDYFCREYLFGRTPNPCVRCNRLVKLGALAKIAAEKGFDLLATGHYARLGYENGRYFIKKAAEKAKDQSYVLCGLSQKTLSALLFPLGELAKTEIRSIAAKAGLKAAAKRDSQDICFIKNGDYADFLTKRTGISSEKGDFIDLDGNMLGKHIGLIHYTVGQRKGLGASFGEPRYVISKNAEKNTVTLGKNADLFASRVTVGQLNFQRIPALEAPVRVTAKIRYSQSETPALLSPDGENAALDFDSPVRTPAPGQSAVFYDGDALVGGGVIL